VTTPSFVEMSIEADLSSGSANIFACMAVVIVASFVLLHARQKRSDKDRKERYRLRNIKPPGGDAASGSLGRN